MSVNNGLHTSHLCHALYYVIISYKNIRSNYAEMNATHSDSGERVNIKCDSGATRMLRTDPLSVLSSACVVLRVDVLLHDVVATFSVSVARKQQSAGHSQARTCSRTIPLP